VPWTIAIVFAAAPSGDKVFYYRGPPSREELDAYAEAHRGAYPPLPDPVRATYLLLRNGGITFFRQTAPLQRDRRYGFAYAEPGRFHMVWVVRSGISTVIDDEVVDFTDAPGTLGFVWSDGSVTAHGHILTCRQITVPRGFFVVVGLAPPLITVARLIRRRAHRAARLRREQCPACGYDVRATRERCPECGIEWPLLQRPRRDLSADDRRNVA
jgi:hypothetical protein